MAKFRQGSATEALKALMKNGLADAETCAVALRETPSISHGKTIHAKIILCGLTSNAFLGNNLLLMYTKHGTLGDANKAFEGIPDPNVVSWSVLISAFVKRGRPSQALDLFARMKTACEPNEFTLVGVLGACSHLGSLHHGKSIHRDITVQRFHGNLHLRSALLDMYVKCGSLEEARAVFDETDNRDTALWNAMVNAYIHYGLLDEALGVFNAMPEKDDMSWGILVSGFAKAGTMEEALAAFNSMPDPAIPVWNSMISGYLGHDRLEKAVKMFRNMPRRSVVSWTTMVNGYADHGFMEEARQLFDEMPEKDEVTWSMMISSYCRHGKTDEAMELFGRTPLHMKRYAWKALVAGCAQNGHAAEAIAMFRETVRNDPLCISLDTLASILSVSPLNHGQQIHARALRTGMLGNGPFVENALIGMYAKHGDIAVARNIFDNMNNPNVVSWTSIISGYGAHGLGVEALELFEQMRCCGRSQPDHVTFVAVLSACCHAGLVAEAYRHLGFMCKDFSIEPSLEHYCIMVDLLGRVGLVYEALALVYKMPLKPNANIWASILAACRTRGILDVGEYAAQRLFENDSSSTTVIVLLSNIYAEAGILDGSDRIARMTKKC